MKEKEIQIHLMGISSEHWIKFNASQIGFYRCNYSPSLLSKLQKAVSRNELGPADRLGIQNDAFSLAKAGLASTVDALSLISHYTNEEDYTVWADLSTNLNELGNLLADTDMYSAFQNYGRNLYRRIAERLGWEERSNESHLISLTRGLVLGQLAKFEEPSVIQHAQRKFEEFLKFGTGLKPDLRKVVYSTVLAHGNQETHDTLLRLYREATLHEEKDRILRSLGSASNPELLNK